MDLPSSGGSDSGGSDDPPAPVLKEFRTGIAQSLELVDSMTEEQKMEAWKTVISLFEQKGSFGLKIDPSPTLSVPQEPSEKPATTCSLDAIDAGEALLLLTEATQKIEDTAVCQKDMNSSGAFVEEMEVTVTEEAQISGDNLNKSDAESDDQRNWKVVVLPEKEGLKRSKDQMVEGVISGERKSNRLAAKRILRNVESCESKDDCELTASFSHKIEAKKFNENTNQSTELYTGPNLSVQKVSNCISDEELPQQIDKDIGTHVMEDVVSYVVQVKETVEETPMKSQTETSERKKVKVQPNNLDHAYHSGDRQIEAALELENEDNAIPDAVCVSFANRKKPCPVCKVLVPETDLKEHQFDHQNTCPVCKKQTSSLGNLIRHVKEVHDSVRPFPCDKCEKGFFKKEYLAKHYKSEHDPSVECPEERYQCDQCERDFSTLFALNVHKEKHMIENKLAEPFACEYCGRTFSYKANLKRHERIHTGNKKHACTVCPKKFIERKSLVNHMYKEHDVAIKGYEKLLKKFECGECHKLYSSAAAIQAHMITHSGLKPHICLQCGQTFGTKTALKRHEDVHAGIKNWECTYCQKRFSEKGSLQAHIRTHTDERPFKCTECDKSFRQKSTLLNHMPVHKPDRNYLCILCGKSFLRRSHYNFHMKKHNTEPSYKCHSCEAAFYRQSDLARHEFTHTGVKPYQCNVCSKKFTRPTYLRDHMNVHEGVKPYRCQLCDETFHETSARSRHAKLCHGQAESQDETESKEEDDITSGDAVYVQAGTQVIKIITQSQALDTTTQLVGSANNGIIIAHGDYQSNVTAQQSLQNAETYIVGVQEDAEQVSYQLTESTEISKQKQIQNNLKEEDEMNFNAAELLKMVDIDPEYLANPEEESAQELQIQTEIPQGVPKTFVIYVKPHAVNSKGESVFDRFG